MNDREEPRPQEPAAENRRDETRQAYAAIIKEERKQRLEKEMRMRSMRIVKS